MNKIISPSIQRFTRSAMIATALGLSANSSAEIKPESLKLETGSSQQEPRREPMQDLNRYTKALHRKRDEVKAPRRVDQSAAKGANGTTFDLAERRNRNPSAGLKQSRL